MTWLSRSIINRFYQKLFQNYTESVYWIDQRSKYVGCNQHYRNFLQIEKTDALVGKDVEQFLKQRKILTEATHFLPKHKGQEKTYYFEHRPSATFRLITLKILDVTLCIEIDLRPSIDLIENLKSKYARLKLRNDKTKTYLTNLIQIVPASIYWKDVNCVILGGNIAHAKLAGFSQPEEVIGKTEYDLIWKDQAALIIENDKKIMSSGIGLKLEESATLADGAIHTFLTSKEPMRDKYRNVVGIIGISLDITELKNLQTELREAKEAAEVANLAKIEFIANMSHDVRTPLTGVVGMAQVLEENLADPQQRQYAHWLKKSGDKLLKMLNQILDSISADNANNAEKIEEAFQLKSIIQELIELEFPSIIMKNIELHTQVDASIPPVLLGDQKKIHHILLNLLGNAIKFTKVGYVKIIVSLLQQTSESALIQFEVIDTGIGIAFDAQSKIFDRFFHVTPTYTGTYEGRGLGLHIAKTYVESLGGEITVDSELDVGTTFAFHLPIKIGDTSMLPPAPEPYFKENAVTTKLRFSPDKHTHIPHILIIEDNSVARTIVELIVQQAGLSSLSTVDAESALKLTETTSFDLIISDIGLPGLSGYEFAVQFRAWEKANGKKPIPIVGLTAHAETHIRNECISSGMNDVFSKPLTLPILQGIIRQFFAHILQPVLPPDKGPSTKQKSCINQDILDTETHLFDLDNTPLIDVEPILIEENFDKTLLIKMLHNFFIQDMPSEKQTFEAAFAALDWHKLENLAHRMKGGIMYLGLKKLQYACQHLEHYHKSGQTKLLHALYQQLMRVLSETELAIEAWLELEKTDF